MPEAAPAPTLQRSSRKNNDNRLTLQPRVPNMCHHRPSGQAYVRIGRRTVYLGPYGEESARRKYDKLIAEWLAGGRQVPQPEQELTITELVGAYMTHVQEYYVNSIGEPTDEQHHMRVGLGMLRGLYGDTPTEKFGPKALLALRKKMEDRGWRRLTVNQMIGRVKRMFRWATEQELVSGSVFHALEAVRGLRRGRCKAPDGKEVKPVPIELVNAIQPFVSDQVWAMIQLQLLTAARPGEICLMKPGEVDRSGKIWIYKPSEHKTAYRGYERDIYLGPKAQGIIAVECGQFPRPGVRQLALQRRRYQRPNPRILADSAIHAPGITQAQPGRNPNLRLTRRFFRCKRVKCYQLTTVDLSGFTNYA